MHVRRAAVLRRELNRRHCRLGRSWAGASPRGCRSRSHEPRRSSSSAQHVLDASERECDGGSGESRANASAVAAESADTPRTRNSRCGGERIKSRIASWTARVASAPLAAAILALGGLREAPGRARVVVHSSTLSDRSTSSRPSWRSTHSCTRRARPPKRTWSAGSPNRSPHPRPQLVLAVSLSRPARPG